MPFENLDIHLGRPIILDQNVLYDKIVRNHRGGYCYELNGCFAQLLRNLGFRVSMLSARVARRGEGFNPEFDHMTLLVHLKERWLADVGFGDSFTEPKQIDNTDPQRDSGRVYQIKVKDGERVLSRWNEQSHFWEPQYMLTLRQRKLEDFTARNLYQQTSPRSHFKQSRLISKLTSNGRITLTDTKFIVTTGVKRVEHRLRSGKQFNRLLRKYFQVNLGDN